MDLENDILYVRATYSDSSERIFRGTRCLEIIESIQGECIARDIVDGNTTVPDYIFDVKNKVFVDCSDTKIEVYRTKPSFSRRVDEFANCFI